MKPYLVIGIRHQTIEFGESEGEARKKAIKSGKIGKWEKEIGGKLLAQEIPLPAGWELRRINEKDSSRRFISIEPGLQAGEPVAGRTGYRAEIVAKRWWVGESLEFLQEDLPGLDRGHVLVCCWFMAERGPRRWKKRWGEWAKSVSGALWHSDWEKAPLPPTSKESS